MNDKLEALREDLKHEREILVVKRKIVRILEKLPDDRARRRVMIATAALCGMYDTRPMMTAVISVTGVIEKVEML